MDVNRQSFLPTPREPLEPISNGLRADLGPVTGGCPAYLARDNFQVPEDTIQHEPQAETASPRRVLTETETRQECGCFTDQYPHYKPRADCEQCHGTGNLWQVTSRTVEVNQPLTVQSLLAHIKTLEAEHQRFRQKASKSMAHAADLLDKAGRVQDAAHTRHAAKAMLPEDE